MSDTKNLNLNMQPVEDEGEEIISLRQDSLASKLNDDLLSTNFGTEVDLDLPESLRSLSPEELAKLEKRTKRKIDLRILPMVVLIYILNYLDRNNLPTAKLAGLDDEMHLTDTQFQTCISILFIGYIIMQIPANMFLNKLGKPSVFITVIMTLWGIISTCTAATQSFGGLLAVRFLLGWVEAGFFGSCLYYLSCWYTRKELSLRNSILYSGSLVSGAFSGLIGAGITGSMDGARGLRAWRWLFIIEGSITVAIVPFAYFILPDMPHNTKWLSQQEKDLVMWKLRREVGQDDSDDMEADKSYRNALVLAFKDSKVWLCTGVLTCLVASLGYSNIYISVLDTLGFSKIKTLLISVPPYIIAVVATFVWARHVDKTGERFWHVTVPLVITIATFIIILATNNTGARYFAMCVMIPSAYCAFTTVLSWMSNSVPRPPMKRAVALAFMNCLSNSTSIWNSYLYLGAPKYTVAFACNIAFLVAAIGFAFLLRMKLMNLNKKIEEGTMDWEKELGKGNDGSKVVQEFRFLY